MHTAMSNCSIQINAAYFVWLQLIPFAISACAPLFILKVLFGIHKSFALFCYICALACEPNTGGHSPCRNICDILIGWTCSDDWQPGTLCGDQLKAGIDLVASSHFRLYAQISFDFILKFLLLCPKHAYEIMYAFAYIKIYVRM